MENIPRIDLYLTGGDNVYDSRGRTCDKCGAVKINGRRFWLGRSFTDMDELVNEALYIASEIKLGSYFTLKQHRISKHHDDYFNYTSRAIAKDEKKLNEKGNETIWWKVDEIVEALKGKGAVEA